MHGMPCKGRPIQLIARCATATVPCLRCFLLVGFYYSVQFGLNRRPAKHGATRPGHAESVQIEYDPDIISYKAGREASVHWL